MQAVPHRPATVPEDAVYNPRRGLWECGDRAPDGQRQGTWRAYRPDGSLFEEQVFQDDSAHGAYRSFHPSGKVARTGSNAHGKPDGDFLSEASEEPGAIPLRGCCIPAGAHTMRAHYDAGRLHGEIFFDAEGRRLLSDGTLFPDHPANVPASARFDETMRQWVVGGRDDSNRPDGQWRHWSPDGALLLDTTYAAGQRHGTTRRYATDGQLLEAQEYRDGMREGAYECHEQLGDRYDGLNVASVHGQWSQQQPVGVWRYLDATGAELAKTDFGTVLELGALLESPALQPGRHTAQHWLELGATLAAEGRVAEAFLARARAAAHGDASALTAHLGRHVRPVAPLLADKLASELIRQRAKQPSVLDWLVLLNQGGNPEEVLRQCARILPPSSTTLDLATTAYTLGGDPLGALLTRATIWLELGRPERAEQDARSMEQQGVPENAADRKVAAPTLIRQHIAAFYPRYEFWPATVDVPEREYEGLPEEVGQPLEAAQSTIAKVALRLALLRERILLVWRQCQERAGLEAEPEPPWMLPETGFLKTSTGDVSLGQWQFELEEDGEQVVIHVAERPDFEGAHLTTLLRRARSEWAALCWLCWGCGLDNVAQPTAITPCAGFAAALGSSMERLWRAQDRLRTHGLKARIQKVPGFSWHGTHIDEVTSLLIPAVCAELKEQRAALFWLADPECQSLWQDDLRPD